MKNTKMDNIKRNADFDLEIKEEPISRQKKKQKKSNKSLSESQLNLWSKSLEMRQIHNNLVDKSSILQSTNCIDLVNELYTSRVDHVKFLIFKTKAKTNAKPKESMNNFLSVCRECSTEEGVVEEPKNDRCRFIGWRK